MTITTIDEAAKTKKGKKAQPTPWDLWDYELALCYRLWRAMPEPPPRKKDPLRYAIWARFTQTAHHQHAASLPERQPPLKDRVRPWPKDPEDVLYRHTGPEED